MNPLKKMKKMLEERDQRIREMQTLEKYKTAGLARQCMECKHFVYRVEKPRNWVCRCPDSEMRFVGGTCLGFSLGSHPEMVMYGSR